jgi:hypothetical protein
MALSLHVRLQNLKNLPPAFDFTEYRSKPSGIFFSNFVAFSENFNLPHSGGTGLYSCLEKDPPAEPEVPGPALSHHFLYRVHSNILILKQSSQILLWYEFKIPKNPFISNLNIEWQISSKMNDNFY